MTRATTFRATAIVGGVLLAILMIMTVSRAAFTDTTSNAGNSWESGEVVLTDDWQGVGAMFTEFDLIPNATDTACIAVIYEGSIAANVVLSSISTTGSTGLAPALRLNITKWDGNECGDGSSVLVYTGPMVGAAAFGGPWSASNFGDSQFYEITWTFPSTADDNLYQGKGAMAAFTWQATG